jgi:hypothetical protein
MFFAMLIASFFSAPSMIIGGLAGWFAAAGRYSQFVAWAFVLLAPIGFYWLVAILVSPQDWVITYDTATAMGMTNLQLAVGAYIGTVFAMLLLFVPMRSARKAWREHKFLLEAAK